MSRVTVVNDNPDFLELVGDILNSDRYDTTLVDGDRADALETIRDSRPDLLMIDLRLGSDGLHGWRIVQEVRRHPEFAGLPILLCSADVVALAEVQSQLNGVRPVEALTKPFSVDTLLETVDRLLEEQRA